MEAVLMLMEEVQTQYQAARAVSDYSECMRLLEELNKLQQMQNGGNDESTHVSTW